ncbi:MAG: adenosine deaminase, partial [Saprospiraceae bacterium]|nr:adenosine deaminase [Saprospiraceae bacterium]MCB0623254.1 adenosine deaminase [Saprospiraceae bacterium]
MDLAGLPKIELHLHLDCSLSFEVVKRLDPAISFEEYRNSFVAPVNCLDLSEYIKRAIPAIQLMQSEEALEAVTLDLFEQLARDSILYAEIRFAPLEHTREGLSVEEVVRSVERAVQRGIRETGIEVRVILCTLRHYNARQSLQTVELVEQFRTGLVVGFDIAADEAGYPIDAHLAAFQYAQRHGIPCTAHAGEACGADSVWETLEHFHPQRIGHGVRSVEDPALVEHLARRQIHLEVCPTSNLQTKVFRQMCDHSIGR